jgi:hypothetical protein
MSEPIQPIASSPEVTLFKPVLGVLRLVEPPQLEKVVPSSVPRTGVSGAGQVAEFDPALMTDQSVIKESSKGSIDSVPPLKAAMFRLLVCCWVDGSVAAGIWARLSIARAPAGAPG